MTHLWWGQVVGQSAQQGLLVKRGEARALCDPREDCGLKRCDPPQATVTRTEPGFLGPECCHFGDQAWLEACLCCLFACFQQLMVELNPTDRGDPALTPIPRGTWNT